MTGFRRAHLGRHVARQKRFYDDGEHEHLRAQSADIYARRLAARLASKLAMKPTHRVLEIGAGFGRFTFPLLSHCASVLAVDVSARALAELATQRDARGIPAARCQTRQADVATVDADEFGRFDFVVGFFILHHLPDYAASIAALRACVHAGGGMGFIEPNRRNPLFLLQVACCSDMRFAEERGMFTLRARGVEAALATAGLTAACTDRFGFFPPALVNSSATLRRLEDRLQDMAPLQWILPFLLCTARLPATRGP